MVERLFWELWDDALNENAMLLMDVGYNRVTNWVVAVWDSSGVGITDAPRVAYTDGLYSRAEAMLAAAKQLVDYIDRRRWHHDPSKPKHSHWPTLQVLPHQAI